MRVEPAGIGKHPDARRADRLGLRDLASAFGRQKELRYGADAENRQELGPSAAHFCREPTGADLKIAWSQLVGRRRAARDDVGDSQAPAPAFRARRTAKSRAA